MTDGTEPIGLALIVCDNIHRDPGTGKRTLLGTFSVIFGAEFPAAVPMIAVYAVLTECKGTFPLILRIIDAKEERDAVIAAEGEIASSDPLAVAELEFKLGGVVSPEPGEYRVELMTNGVTILSRRIVLMQRQRPGQNPPVGEGPTDA